MQIQNSHECVFLWNRSMIASAMQNTDPFMNSISVEKQCSSGKGNAHCLRRPNQNIVPQLLKRETGFLKPSVSSYHATRNFYLSVVPNVTIEDIEEPCYLRKFSPDGKYFIGFSDDGLSVEIYEYKGPSAGETFLHKYNGDHSPINESKEIRRNIFHKFFHLKHSVNAALNDDKLEITCLLFTDDCNFIIVGSYAGIKDAVYFSQSLLENYTLYIIDLRDGVICDKRVFKTDRIYLIRNYGLHMYRDFLCVLSMEYHIIHVFKITQEGHFINVRCLGWPYYDDDESVLLNIKYPEWKETRPTSQFPRDYSFNTLKHKFLIFQFKRHLQICEKINSRKPLLGFYKSFKIYSKLWIHKVQMIDESHLIIRYMYYTNNISDLTDREIQPAFYVIYNMTSDVILDIYDNTSKELLWKFQNSCDLFRSASGQVPCSPSNNNFARLIQRRLLHEAKSQKEIDEAIMRILFELPEISQSYSYSPYLDLSLFSYDNDIVSVSVHPKAFRSKHINFYARDSGSLHCIMNVGIQDTNYLFATEKLVTLIFHPHDPFAFSIVEYDNGELVTNLHIRHASCECLK